MANYDALKSAIQSVIKENGNNEITGPILQQTLIAIINALGDGYQYVGVANPNTNPGTPDQNVFYVTGGSGDFSNFGLVVNPGEVAILRWNGTWNKDVSNATTKEQVDTYAREIGVNSLARLVDGGTAQFEQGEITATGQNTANKAYIRFVNAIETPYLLGAPAGYKIESVFYYSSWTDAEHFTFAAKQVVNGRLCVCNLTYPYARIVIGREVTARMSVNDFLGTLSLFSLRASGLLPVEFQNDYNYDTNDGTVSPANNTASSLILPYSQNPYTNILELGYTVNALYWSDSVYLGYSTNSIDGPTTWATNNHALPITRIAFGVYGIPTTPVYYRDQNPEIIKAKNEAIEQSRLYIKDADFSRTVIMNSVYNDDNGVILPLNGYSRTDKFPLLQNGTTNAMSFPVGSCETLYWHNDTYLGYTQNKPYQDTPDVWKVADHSLTVTHVAFCWNSTNISEVYYIVRSGVFVDKEYVDGQIANTKTYVDEQDNALRNSIGGIQNDLSGLSGSVAGLGADVEQINQDIETINDALSQLAGEVPPGAISGNNVWTGSNQFTQPISGVAGSNENNVALLSQLHNATVAHRWTNAKDFGFLPENTGSVNTAAMNSALQGGNKTVVVTEPGTYKVNGAILLHDNTTVVFGAGVIIQKDGHYQNIFRNAGATSRSYNRNITLVGLVLSINEKGMANDVDGTIYGLRGELAFLCTENVKIFDFRCEDLHNAAYAIQFNQSYNFVIENFVIRGHKDGIHLSSVDTFVVRNGILETEDDALAFNACDWIGSNCVDGDINNGIVENVVDETPSFTQSGFACRLLCGAWKNWTSGMQIRRGDTVVNNNRIYRAYYPNPTTTVFVSGTQPTITTFAGKQEDSGGFYWKLMRDDSVYYSCNIQNVEFRNCQFNGQRNGFYEEVDTDSEYNRSLYPGLEYSQYPKVKITIKGFSFKNKNYEPIIASAFTHSHIRVDGFAGTGTTLQLNSPTNAALYKRMDAANVDFRGYNGAAYNVRSGQNTEIHLRDCVANGAISVAVNGRLVSDSNVNNLPTGPAKGDGVLHNQTPKIFNGGSWVSLI